MSGNGYQTPITRHYNGVAQSPPPQRFRYRHPANGIFIASSLFYAASIAIMVWALLSPSWYQYSLSVFGQEPIHRQNVTVGINVELGIIGRLRVKVFGGGALSNITVVSNHFALGFILTDMPVVEFDWWRQTTSCVSGNCLLLAQNPQINHLSPISGTLNPLSCAQAQNNTNMNATATYDGSYVTVIPSHRFGETWVYNSMCSYSVNTLGILCACIATALFAAIFTCGVAVFSPRMSWCWSRIVDGVFIFLSLCFATIVLVYYGVQVGTNFTAANMYIRAFVGSTEFAVYPGSATGYFSYCWVLVIIAAGLNVAGLAIHLLRYCVPNSVTLPRQKEGSVVVI